MVLFVRYIRTANSNKLKLNILGADFFCKLHDMGITQTKYVFYANKQLTQLLKKLA